MGIFVLCVVLPVAAWRVFPWYMTVQRRARQYDDLYNTLEHVHGEMRQVQSKYEASLAQATEALEEQQDIVRGLLRLLNEAGTITFDVVDVTWQKNEAYLVITDGDTSKKPADFSQTYCGFVKRLQGTRTICVSGADTT